MTRAQLAEQKFYEGYACSQALALAFNDIIKMDEVTLLKMTLPLGGGLSRLRETCGAISSMAQVAGLIFSSDNFTNENKLEVYKIVQELISRFKSIRSTINCLELLKTANLHVETGGSPEARTDEYYKKRPCGKIVYDAAYVLEEYLIERNIIKNSNF